MRDPMLHTMDKDMMDIMLRDWMSDNPDVLNIDFDSIRYDDEYGHWSATAIDKEGDVYTLIAYDGNIILNS